MCNNTGRDQLMVSGNSQLSNDVSSDSDELDKMVDEQINNSNNSSESLSNLNNLTHHQPIDSLTSNGLADSFNSANTARFLQTINLLLSSLPTAVHHSSDDQQPPPPPPQLNNELLESIQRLLSGNQTLTNSLLAAANQQRTSWFACKFCAFTTAKRQQLIKHVRTNCEGLLNVVANLNLQTTATAATNAATTTTTTTASSTNSTNTHTTQCGSPSAGEQQSNHASEDSSNAAQLLNSLNADQLNAGCGNPACVNSNCTNGNSCVILPNAGNLLNSDKYKSPAADDSEDDLMNSTNPQDRYCMECEIQFASYKNYKVSLFFVFF